MQIPLLEQDAEQLIFAAKTFRRIETLMFGGTQTESALPDSPTYDEIQAPQVSGVEAQGSRPRILQKLTDRVEQFTVFRTFALMLAALRIELAMMCEGFVQVVDNFKLVLTRLRTLATTDNGVVTEFTVTR
jgi:hypothetical protein